MATADGTPRPASSWLIAPTLRGSLVTLAPLSAEHHDGLVEAVRDGELWKLWFTTIPTPSMMREEIDRRFSLQQRGMMLPFSVFARGAIVGMTTYMNIEPASRRLEIGSTWYRASVQRTLVNTEAKSLLLRHAFETLECIAVEFRTSSFNRPSRRAIERIGAKLDGVLRSHGFHANGTLRDTYVYSILASEWPAIKAHLAHQCDRSGAGAPAR